MSRTTAHRAWHVRQLTFGRTQASIRREICGLAKRGKASATIAIRLMVPVSFVTEVLAGGNNDLHHVPAAYGCGRGERQKTKNPKKNHEATAS